LKCFLLHILSRRSCICGTEGRVGRECIQREKERRRVRTTIKRGIEKEEEEERR